MADTSVDVQPRPGWSMSGGGWDDDSLLLYIGTAAGRHEVTLPISVGADGELTVGEASIRVLPKPGLVMRQRP